MRSLGHGPIYLIRHSWKKWIIIKGREHISALSINNSFSSGFAQRDPAIPFVIKFCMSIVCVSVVLCLFLFFFLFFLYFMLTHNWSTIHSLQITFNRNQYVVSECVNNTVIYCITNMPDTLLLDTSKWHWHTAHYLLNVSHQLVDYTHSSAHYAVHSNSYIATAADCLATAAKTSRGVHRVFQMTPFLFTNAFYDFFSFMSVAPVFITMKLSLTVVFSISCPQISAPYLMWQWPETVQQSAANWATQTPAGCPGIPPLYARPGTPRNSPPSCLTRREGAWDAWQTGAPGWVARSTGRAFRPPAVPIPAAVMTPVRTAPWRRCPWV